MLPMEGKFFPFREVLFSKGGGGGGGRAANKFTEMLSLNEFAFPFREVVFEKGFI